ncbi:type II toxin-antitoxin system RelE/ParE family toxin [Butyrivibrio sp. INlla14]|uniref:type II toxin-antitoxin system RelE/ParE family toxin n=1 Tax=Butyrivibrio sp. INlla14 TaxID=1520808 RepID=UPI000876A165|nr:type II toxin-antitoxin system RelE/ParE family toxin [Butyrivibrio sp. INlla14]SCY69606.1 Phage derived protein Gp49-like [Butyrivibrio sp. INlla14]
MEIFDYVTLGGKNLIIDYIDSLPASERLELYDIRNEIRESGLDAFEKLNTRQLRGKLWEIKASQTRIMYIVISTNGVAFLHICKKKKGKAEKKEIEKALSRAKREGLM